MVIRDSSVRSIALWTDKDRWNQFASTSPQGNPFCATHFMDCLGQRYDLLVVEEDGRPQLGAVVITDGAEPISAPQPYTLYQGVLFDRSLYALPLNRRVKLCLELVGLLLEGMERRYGRASWCLHHCFDDLRAFQWFHYHEAHKGQFKIDLYYTGVINLDAHQDFEAYMGSIRRVRRAEYRQAISSGLTTEISRDADALVRLHELTFRRQGIAVSRADCERVRVFLNAGLASNIGELLVCKTRLGEIVAAQFALFDKESVYFAISGNDPDYRHLATNVFLTLEHIRRSFDSGFKRVDFLGINSPNRGDFKTSLNAVPTPYFVVTWERPAG